MGLRPDNIPPRTGVGLRREHHQTVYETALHADWLEVHPERFMRGGNPLDTLLVIRAHYPLSIHAVGLSIGAASGMHGDYLTGLKELIGRTEPGLVSGHLAWNMARGIYVPDLMALPYTDESLAICAANIDASQEGWAAAS